MYQENIKAKKKYGQNFLNNQGIINKIVSIINPKNKKIIEIGPGMGALTKELVKESSNLIAFEIDTDMINYLNQINIFDGIKNKIINEDFLESNLSDYKEFEIVGNIPYYITSEIIFKIIDNRFLFKRAVLMVQKEVADRIVATINSSEYSKLSLSCQYVAKVKKELIVKKDNFTPVPKVDSAIVSFYFYQKKDDDFDRIKEFFKLCFLARRKKLIWSLSKKYKKEDILNTFKKLNLDENIRIQQLDLNCVLKLYNLLKDQ
ncbi:16S rRNA (adenine(1518)-N(6)/adenine(1519)-N(6))-dimethyltransferase RsmA [Mycoplasma sp. U97]|uniref:16S rRNA (adenine(1518)-N(6)/adenine(1519)-N(6))- dimethyltransferase RsmA n=1 Tax=Mycoplasma tauri TaxID=547987 RepID=UPI001CBCF0A5|nr:16S rRNA (adenine(1518)-N(6)/adenine(1519)-N(6))-dimethyltransferase RsmA [Mycoplasma tauri]MBZ4212792.1 16S rRNA (adenine(1518)-N(6)/adenine(1519)-N(6))-dimethyltransferase RsmA [Mycoplasma tauri]